MTLLHLIKEIALTLKLVWLHMLYFTCSFVEEYDPTIGKFHNLLL